METTMQIKNFVTCKEAAGIIGCTADHVRLLARQGRIKSRQFGERTWMIDRQAAINLRDNPPETGRPRGGKEAG